MALTSPFQQLQYLLAPDPPLLVLDFGAQNIRAATALVTEKKIVVLKYVSLPSQSFQNKTISHMEKFTETLQEALDLLEVKKELSLLSFSLPANLTTTQHQTQEIPLPSRPISQKELFTLAKKFQQTTPQDQNLLHTLPTTYQLQIDSSFQKVQNPLGLCGESLQCQAQLIYLSHSREHQFMELFHQVPLSIPAQPVLDILAGASGCLWKEEKEEGVTLIELGATHTSIVTIQNDHIVFFETLPLGGDHLTKDLAQQLQVPFFVAEHLKTTLISGQNDPKDTQPQEIFLPAQKGFPPTKIQKTPLEIKNIIFPRLKGLFEQVKETIAQSPYPHTAKTRFVLTGGGAHIPHIEKFATPILNAPTRIGIPLDIPGLPKESRWTPLAGLLILAKEQKLQQTHYEQISAPSLSTSIRSMLKWFQQNF